LNRRVYKVGFGEMPDKALSSVHDMSQYLGRSPSTIYRLVAKEEIPHIRKRGVGLRFPKDAIDEWLQEGFHKPRSYAGDIGQLKRAILNTPLDGDITPPGGDCEMPKGKSKSRLNLGYGAVYLRKTKAGAVRWYLDYRDGHGDRVQKVAPLARTKDEAALALREEVRRVFNGFYGLKGQEQRTGFKEFVEMFIENYSKVNKRSWKDDKCRLYGLASFFGDVSLQDVSPLDIEKFKSASISKGLSKSTVNRYLAILKRMFNVAITWGKAKDNPMKQVKLYSECDNLKERILSPDEEARLLANSPEHLAPILIVALNTGMRRGEILGLTWEQVDFKAKEIRVMRT
jgi:excisionase family DNA binding protein